MCVYVGMSFMGYILVWQSDGTFGFPPQKYTHIQQHTKICIKFQGFLFKFMNSTPQNIKMEHPWKCEGFTDGSEGKESACNSGDLSLIPGLGRSPEGGHGYPLQYSCLKNPHGQRNLSCCSPWGHKESEMTEWLSTVQQCLAANKIWNSSYSSMGNGFLF